MGYSFIQNATDVNVYWYNKFADAHSNIAQNNILFTSNQLIYLSLTK